MLPVVYIFWIVYTNIFDNIWRNIISPSWSNQCISCQGIWCNEVFVFYKHLIDPYIQGVSRLLGITAGGDFLGLCDEKSSYKHVSDFGRLESYDRFLIPVHALVWTTFMEPAGGIMNSAVRVISTL